MARRPRGQLETPDQDAVPQAERRRTNTRAVYVDLGLGVDRVDGDLLPASEEVGVVAPIVGSSKTMSLPLMRPMLINAFLSGTSLVVCRTVSLHER